MEKIKYDKESMFDGDLPGVARDMAKLADKINEIIDWINEYKATHTSVWGVPVMATAHFGKNGETVIDEDYAEDHNRLKTLEDKVKYLDECFSNLLVRECKVVEKLNKLQDLYDEQLEEPLVECHHQCSGNCRRVGCNCSCGEYHDEKAEQIKPTVKEYIKKEYKCNKCGAKYDISEINDNVTSMKCSCEPTIKEVDINLNRRKIEGCSCEGYCTKECDCKCHKPTVKECEHIINGYCHICKIVPTKNMFPTDKSEKIEEIIKDFEEKLGEALEWENYDYIFSKIEPWLRDKLKSL